MYQANWKFFQPIGKKIGTGNWTQFCLEKKPWSEVPFLCEQDNTNSISAKRSYNSNCI